MLRIGRYRIGFGWCLWFQTKVPTQVWHFLFIWVLREARPDDQDKKPRFPFWTRMEYEGRTYRYCKGRDDSD